MDTPQAVIDARSNAAKLGSTAADFAAGAQTIPDQLKKAVNEALNYNADILAPRASALSDYLASPAQANAKFGVQQFTTGPQAGQANPDYIFNPFERNSAIQTYITNQLTPFTMFNSLLGARQGSTADIINAGTNSFNAQAVAAQKAAEAAQQAYKDVFNEYVTNTQLGQEQQKINQSGSANNMSDLLTLLQGILGGNNNGNATGGTGEPGDAFVVNEPNKNNTSTPLSADAFIKSIQPKSQFIQLPVAAPTAPTKALPKGTQNNLTLSSNTNPFSNLQNLNIKGLKL